MNHRKLLRRGTAMEPTPTQVLGGRTIRLSSNPAPTSLAIRFKSQRLEPQCELRKESDAYRTAPSRITRSNWGDSKSWSSPRVTKRWIGQRVARPPQPVLWGSVPLHLNPSAGSRDEWKRSGEHSPDDRAGGPRVIRPSGGIPLLTDARRGQLGGCAQRRADCRPHHLAARRRATKSGGLAADGGASLIYRSCASSASRFSERAHSTDPQGGARGDDLVGRVSR